MRSTPLTRRVVLIAGLVACGKGEAPPADTAAAPAAASPTAGQAAQEPRNACRLLTAAEVNALVEKPVALANRTAEEPGYSECQWEDASGFPLFIIKAYWAGGRRNFDVWRTAQRLGDDIFEKQEGVRTDSIVKQGPVRGLGDAAYFSEIFPSLVLKGDTMFELSMHLVPTADAKFRALATTLLARLK